jgi:N-acetylneuraminic acid mutarotase
MIQQPLAKFWSSVLAIAYIASGFTVMAQEQVSEFAVFKDLPQGIASFGAAELGDYVYVYSGHTGKTHVYSLDAMSKGFFRASLKQGGSWECLPMERPAQGVALLAVDHELYRIGGMQAQNESERPHDLFSLSEVAAFDPNTRTWRRLPDLPDPRSSHRGAVLRNHIYVFGGWTLQGGEDGMWLDHGLVLDRNNESAGWTVIPQPVQRRALEVISYGGRVWLIGGLTPEDEISQQIHIFDPVSESWTHGPNVPGLEANGNGIAAAVVGESLVLAGMDGKIYRLRDDQKSWVDAGKLPSSRIHHRLIGDSDRLLVIAGATRTGHLKSAEFVSLHSGNGN